MGECIYIGVGTHESTVWLLCAVNVTISSFTKESCRYRLVALVGIDSDGDGLMDKLVIKLDQMFSADSDWFLYVCVDF